MKTDRKMLTLKKQLGVGLIEILITIVLLSIGFLAAARMQVEGMRFSHSAYYQSQAYFLANDMINRMRTNSKGVQNGNYLGIATSPTSNDPGCDSSACGPSELAQQDVYDWGGYFYSRDGSASFIPALPSSENVTAGATVVAVNNDIWAVELVWSEIVDGEVQAETMTVNFALER